MNVKYQKTESTDFFNPGVFKSLMDRLEKINDRSERKWGTMTPAQMLHHLNLAIGGGLGFYTLTDVSNIFTRTFGPFIFLRLLRKFPAGIPTVKPLEVSEDYHLETEKEKLKEILNFAFQTKSDKEWGKHPSFGSLGRKNWGKLIMIHCNHHFQQFSC